MVRRMWLLRAKLTASCTSRTLDAFTTYAGNDPSLQSDSGGVMLEFGTGHGLWSCHWPKGINGSRILKTLLAA
jgi:hypothetical protein